jgi:uncharacterized alkaline shock family protein YloU
MTLMTVPVAGGRDPRYRREGAETVSRPETESTTASTTTGAVREAAPPRRSAELTSEHGSTTIADLVVAKIAAMAAREIEGVYAMGGGTARVMGAVRQRVPGARASYAQGVAVEVGQRQAAADIDLVVEYGVCIPDLATAIRTNVISAVERICGLEVTEVNVNVDDIHIPGDQDADSSSEQRVQ